MPTATVHREVDVPASLAFTVLSDIERFPENQADTISIRFLTEQRSGVGTRFVETRSMGEHTMDTELEVTELEPGRRIRMVADSHGTVWDTTMSVTPLGDARCRITFAMVATGHKLMAKLMNVVMAGRYRKGIEDHLDDLKARLEAQRSGMQQDSANARQPPRSGGS